MSFEAQDVSGAPSELPVSVVSVVFLSLPVVASELLSAVQGAIVLSIAHHEAFAYALPSFAFAGIFCGLLTVFVGFYSDFSPLLRPRFLLLGGEVLAAVGVVLLLIVDDDLGRGRFRGDGERRTPFAYAIPGLVLLQLSANALQLCGRSLLARHLPADAQAYAHAWAATFLHGASFLFRLVLGLTVARDAPEFSGAAVRAAACAFAAVALALATVAIVSAPGPAYAPRAALAGVFGADSFQNFFKLALPFLVGQIAAAALEFASPLAAEAAAPGFKPGLHPVDGFASGYIGLACGALVAVAAAWLSRSRLGARGALALSLLLAASFSALLAFVSDPPTVPTAVVQAVFAGAAPGALASAGWAIVAAEVPREAIGKYIGLVIGLAGALRALAVFVFESAQLLVPSVFVLAAMFTVALPGEAHQGMQIV
jgi:hypothetical protein